MHILQGSLVHVENGFHCISDKNMKVNVFKRVDTVVNIT
jgi:hypothetical protein